MRQWVAGPVPVQVLGLSEFPHRVVRCEEEVDNLSKSFLIVRNLSRQDASRRILFFVACISKKQEEEEHISTAEGGQDGTGI